MAGSLADARVPLKKGTPIKTSTGVLDKCEDLKLRIEVRSFQFLSKNYSNSSLQRAFRKHRGDKIRTGPVSPAAIGRRHLPLLSLKTECK
jgi:hypothetical protein